MKIVNRKKFIRSNLILVILLGTILFFANNKEEYIYAGDTLWTIAQNELKNNKYFYGKDIRYVVDELKNINNLSSSSLREGEKIKIPNY